MVRMFITNLKSILKIRLKAHIFPRTFADLLPLCYDYNTKHLSLSVLHIKIEAH